MPERRLLAVASGGGHWVQLFRMRPAWDGLAVDYLTTDPGYRADVIADAAERGQPEPGYHVVTDANRWQKLRLARQLGEVSALVLRLRPDLVISTGASVGYFALRLARLSGARTVWIDSIANAEEISLSGARARRHADLFLTQWAHLAEPERGIAYRGAVL